MNVRSHFTKTKYPKLYDFYTKHCINPTYHFHVFKCLQPDCEWHSPSKSGKIGPFGEPVPEEGPNGVTHYVQGNDPTEKYILSQLKNPSKRNHGMPFTATAQAALNVSKLIKCPEYQKTRLIYAKKKLFPQNLLSLKRVRNDFQYVYGTFLQDVPKDDRKPDSQITELVFCRENLSCCSPVEIP